MTTKYQLYIYLSKHNDDEEWVGRYKQKVQHHNQKITDSAWGSLFPTAATPDSGFDLFMPHDGEEYDNANILREKVRKNDPPLPLHVGVDGARSLNLGVRCCMRVTPPTTGTGTTTTTTTIPAAANNSNM